MQIVQSRGSRGLRLVGAAALSFPASQIFIHCDIFPAEFSLVATFKAARLKEKVKEEMLLYFQLRVIPDYQKTNELLSCMMFFLEPHARLTDPVVLQSNQDHPVCRLWSQLVYFKRNEFIFSLVEEKSALVLLGLRMSRNRLQLLVQSSGSTGHSRLTFKEVDLDDNRWHTVALAVTGHYTTLTVDCGLPKEL